MAPTPQVQPSLFDRLIDTDSVGLGTSEGVSSLRAGGTGGEFIDPAQSRIAAATDAARTGDVARWAQLTIRWDLEWLLNTCRVDLDSAAERPAGSRDGETERYPLLRQSLQHYGLRDFTGMSAGSDQHRVQLLEDVRWAVRTFEPRFSRVEVESETAGATGTDDGSRLLRFKISGALRESASAKVPFVAEFDLVRGTFAVAADAREAADA
jgi:type VI secretion system lysozyme-like protein